METVFCEVESFATVKTVTISTIRIYRTSFVLGGIVNTYKNLNFAHEHSLLSTRGLNNKASKKYKFEFFKGLLKRHNPSNTMKCVRLFASGLRDYRNKKGKLLRNCSLVFFVYAFSFLLFLIALIMDWLICSCILPNLVHVESKRQHFFWLQKWRQPFIKPGRYKPNNCTHCIVDIYVSSKLFN